MELSLRIAGARAMTGTSVGGFALVVEGLQERDPRKIERIFRDFQ